MEKYQTLHARSISDPEGFWREHASLVEWQTPFGRVLDDSRPPFARWFVGGKTNLCHNAVDRHLTTRADQNALIFVSTETGQEKVYSFRELHAEVQRMAAILQELGVRQGDRIFDKRTQTEYEARPAADSPDAAIEIRQVPPPASER